MSNCQNKASSYVTCLKCVCFYSKTMTRYFHNYPKVLCTFQILSEEMKSPKQIGGDPLRLFEGMLPSSTIWHLQSHRADHWPGWQGLPFRGKSFTSFTERFSFTDHLWCIPVNAARYELSDDIFQYVTMSGYTFSMDARCPELSFGCLD